MSIIIAHSPSTMSTSTHTHSHSPTINGTKAHNHSNGNYQEQRKKYIDTIYNKNNGTINIHNSSTSHAASESFIRDIHSPLFNAMDPSQHAHKPSPRPVSMPSKFKQIANNSKPNKTPKLSQAKSFTVTPPNSPSKHTKDGNNTSKSFQKSKSFSCTNSKPHPSSSMATMQILKDLAIIQDQQRVNKGHKEIDIDNEVKINYIEPIKATKSAIKSTPKSLKPLPAKLKHAATTTNIHQNVDIIPPKKMKKKATTEELQLVLDHFEMAKDKDIESILRENEPHVIEYRDKMYAQARKSGITSTSDDMIRLKVLGHVVQYAYMNIEPPNEYTKQTDRKHFKEVGAWTAKFAKNKGIVPPLTLIYSAWCHDIERFIPATKCEYLPEAVDKYRKQVIHGVTSAKVATCLLKGAPVTQYEIDRIYDMVLHHDIPQPREDIVILGKKLIDGAKEDLMWELELLMDADSFAFFQSTIVYFILFKAKKNSPDWIWERVRNNVKRLRPHLRPKAAQCIHQLSHDVLSKMNVNYQELAHLCSDSGQNSDASTTNSSPSKPTAKPKLKPITSHPQLFFSMDAPTPTKSDEVSEISENENVSYLSAENLTKMDDNTDNTDNLENVKFSTLKITESSNSNTSHSFDSERCEHDNVDINDNKHI